MTDDGHLAEDVLVVATDHFKGMKKAVAYLAEQGHKGIAYLSFDSSENDNKYMGYKAGMAELGLEDIEIDSADMKKDGTPFSSAFESAAILIEKQHISAVICQNDESALGLISGLTQKGVKVPQDISVMGYDNLPFAEFANPTLTTLAQKLDEIAHHGTKLLVSCIEANDVQRDYLPSKMLIEPDLIIRESTCKKR